VKSSKWSPTFRRKVSPLSLGQSDNATGQALSGFFQGTSTVFTDCANCKARLIKLRLGYGSFVAGTHSNRDHMPSNLAGLSCISLSMTKRHLQ
jgi:hypothetical protein